MTTQGMSFGAACMHILRRFERGHHLLTNQEAEVIEGRIVVAT